MVVRSHSATAANIVKSIRPVGDFASLPDDAQAADSAAVNDASLIDTIIPLTGLVYRLREGIDVADPQSVTTAGLTGFLAAVRQNPATWRLLLARDGLPPAAAEARERARKYFVDQLGALATWALADRAGGPLDPMLTAQLIVSGLEMGALLVLNDPDGFSQERMVAFVAEVVRSILQG